MKIAIMQPYFLPYIGYFQLIGAVDKFVIYDSVEYTKKGWVNRNRLLRNSEPATFTLPLKKGSDYLNIDQRELSGDFDRGKMLSQFEGAYRKAAQFRNILPVLQDIFSFEGTNLFKFIHHSLIRCCGYLGIETPILIASELEGPSHGKGLDRVLGLCDLLEADCYVNPVGGQELYRPSVFRAKGLDLRFLKSRIEPYPQFGGPFQPSLSIIDVLAFNTNARLADMLLNGFELVEGREAADVFLD